MMDIKYLSSLVFSLSFLFLSYGLRPCSSVNTNGCKTEMPSTGEFRGMFVFGSSTVDNGNNNGFANTSTKANYLPYGIDFKPAGATGRFTNSKNFADRIGDLLKLPLLPSYAEHVTKGVAISHGVNHASAGSGILDDTCLNKEVSSLSQQVRNFINVTLSHLQAQQPECSTIELLQNHLFLVSTGSYDYLYNFFQRGKMHSKVTPQFFTANLTASLGTQLMELYSVGARKVAFLNIGPLGCTPMSRSYALKRECHESLNYFAYLFNNELIQMLDVMKPQMPGFHYVVINYFQIGLELIFHPATGGFDEVRSSCCEVAGGSDGIVCKEGGSVCANRSSHLFFDGFHPTEGLYGILASRAYSSNDKTEVYPFNIQKLAQV